MGQNSSSLSSKDGTRAEDEMKIPTLQETFHINGQDSTHCGKTQLFLLKSLNSKNNFKAKNFENLKNFEK